MRLLPIALFTLTTLLGSAPAFALNPHTDGSTGQPNCSCGSSTAPTTPGHTATAPGSAFNPTGVSGGVYAGQQPQNSNNPKSVSQYDAACFEVSQH